ncbi:hypothetical protein ElyMa_000301300 [Elysia marginata]|uniref:Uncharacterized protein n=1 Tax=Elysia marginata TaxID=1093978 RepID=A0AAV4FAT1_9GAST|nr:hypothetical protein ElyMa_000301300 [Elysia marginata]
MNAVGFEPAPLAGTNRLARPEPRRTDHSAIHFHKNENLEIRINSEGSHCAIQIVKVVVVAAAAAAVVVVVVVVVVA